MRVPGIGLIAFGLTVASFPPAFAAPVLYKVTPKIMPGSARLIVGDMAWSCSSGSCVAARTGKSTDATVCSALASDLGLLASFAVGENAFDAAAIERCNRRAR